MIAMSKQMEKIKSKENKNKETMDMFGNCFFPLFFVSKNNFLFLRLKNLFGNSKWTENKICSQNSIVKETENMQKVVFSYMLKFWGCLDFTS